MYVESVGICRESQFSSEELERFLRKKSTRLISPAKKRETGASFWFLKFASCHAAFKFVASHEDHAV